MPARGPDREGAMARADLYKGANYSLKLFKKLSDDDQMEAWVQAKITKAADYIASVYHYLEYEMKFSEYGKALDQSEMYSEDQKAVLKGKLMEAKEKIKALKIKQADKKDKKEKEVKEEKSSTGGEIDRSKKGVTKHKQNTDRFSDEPHTEPKSQAKSQSAADKADDKAADKAEEKEGKNWEKRFGKDSVTRVKDGKKVDEATTVNYDKDGKRTGVTHKDERKYSDEPHTEPKSQAKSRSAADKAGDKAADKAAEKDSKAYEKKHPGTVTRVKDGKKVSEALKGGQKNLDTDNDDDIDEKDLANLRAKKKVKEATDEKCNETAKGKSCPVHGMKECSGMYEAKGKMPDANNDNIPDYAQDGRGPNDTKKKGAAPKKGVNPFAKKNVKEAIAKAKKKLDKDLDEVQSPFPSRNETDPAKKAANAAVKPGTANPAMPSRNKAPEVVKESVELVRMKTLMTRLNG
jgi:hypothetical protein